LSFTRKDGKVGNYIVKRILGIIPIMLGVTIITFSMIHLCPGDPAVILAGSDATQEGIEKIREEYGLNDPLFKQYFDFMNRLLRGDLGISLFSKIPITELLAQRYWVTMKLAIFGILISFLIGIFPGVVAAVKQYSVFDNLSMIGALFGASMPIFWIGLLLMLLFSVKIRLFPAGGGTDLYSLVLPALSLGAYSAALIARITRASMLEVIRQDYVRTARANGLRENIVIYKHCLKNAMIPIITVVGLQFGYLLGGTVLVEVVFSIPGMGKLLVDSIFQRDYPVVQASMILVSLSFVVVNLLTDIAYAFFDPRIRYQ
jgi:peptide/nickel transport system permease protein